MALRRNYSETKSSESSTSFAGKYALKKVTNIKEEGDIVYFIPLDLARGFITIPIHTVNNYKQGGEEKGFKSKYSSKIYCKHYDRFTGEPTGEEGLCCKLSQLEKERLAKPDNANTPRIVSYRLFRNVMPVLVLNSTEAKPSRRSPKNITLNDFSFAFLDISDYTYETEFLKGIIDNLENADLIDNSTSEEEKREKVNKFIQNCIIQVKLVKKSLPSPFPEYKAISVSRKGVCELTGEHDLLVALVKFLSGQINPTDYDKVYATFPQIKEINNQVTDFISIFDVEAEKIYTDWNEEELQAYYDSYIAMLNSNRGYADAVTANQEALTYMNNQTSVPYYNQQQVVYNQPAQPAYPDPNQYAYAQPQVAPQPVAQPAYAPQPQVAPQPVLVGAGVATAPQPVAQPVAQPATEADYDYSANNAQVSSILSDDDFGDYDFMMEDDDTSFNEEF
jgi:hypothetical protein